MKKITIIIAAAALVMAACGGKAAAEKAYGELFDSTTQSIKAVSADLKAAKDGKAVAAALNKFVDTMTAMKTKADELDKKYNMRFKGEEMPLAFKAKNDEFMKAIEEFTKTDLMSIAKYASDPEVKKALERMQNLKG